MTQPDKRHHAPRRPGYDYTQAGQYVVTARTRDGRAYFGTVAQGAMHPSPAGDMIAAWWGQLPQKFPALTLDAFVVMPNHIHGILEWTESAAVALPDVMRWFKAMTTNAYIRGVKADGWPCFPGKLWQRSYYDHIIRDAASLERIREYIHANPANWKKDSLNPD